MKKVVSLFKVLFLPLCIASLIGVGGVVVVDDALAAPRSAKRSASKHGPKKKSTKTKCNKRRGIKTYLLRSRCRPVKLLNEIAPSPGDFDLPEDPIGEIPEPIKPEEPIGEIPEPEDLGLIRMCVALWQPVHIITTEGCYTFSNSCMVMDSLKGKEILSRGDGACPGFGAQD